MIKTTTANLENGPNIRRGYIQSGKYEGKSVEEIIIEDIGYISWALNNGLTFLTQDLMEMYRNEMKKIPHMTVTE